MTSGVPQGSILGQLLFLLYQNNLSNSINHSKIATFADGTKIYKVINKEADASAMENDLANFQTSSANANLLLNTDKCKKLRITRKRNKINHTYKLQDSALKTTDYKRDLGVWTSSTLTWSKQVLHHAVRSSQQIPRVYSTVHDQNQDHLCSSDAISYTRSFPPRICVPSLGSTVC